MRSTIAWAAACAFAAAAIAADVYPVKPVRIVVPFPPGGPADVLARTVGDKLQASLGQPVVVDNRPGAGGNIGMELVAKAAPDGHTLALAPAGNLTVNPSPYRSVPYDVGRDFAPVTVIAAVPNVLVVNANVPAKDLAELIAYAKANPGKLNYAHAGAGNVTHLTGEMFRTLAGIDFVNVPHKGGNESVQGVLGNQVDFALESPVILLPLIKEGKLRALAVTSAKRQAEIADVPTMVESGINGFVATLLTGVVAPAGTPGPIVGKLNSVINETLKSPDMKDLVVRFGSEARIGSPREFGTFLAGETQKWANIAKQAGVALD